MNGVIEGKLVAVGESRDGVYQLDLATQDEKGDYTRSERVSGFEEAASEFAKLKGVNVGSKIRVAYKQNGVFKNIDLTADNPLQVKIAAVKPRSPDYRLFHPANERADKSKAIVWLACLKAAATMHAGLGRSEEAIASSADEFQREYEKRFEANEE